MGWDKSTHKGTGRFQLINGYMSKTAQDAFKSRSPLHRPVRPFTYKIPVTMSFWAAVGREGVESD